jgi:hypothetical protein
MREMEIKEGGYNLFPEKYVLTTGVIIPSLREHGIS